MAWLDWIGTFFSKEKEQQVAKEARGVSVGTPGQAGQVGSGNLESEPGYGNLCDSLGVDQDLMRRYADYENMDDYPETSMVLDRYADDSTIPDSIHNKTIWSISRDKVFRDLIDDCMHRRVQIEEDIWVAVRTLCKYGNLFGEVLVNETGVVGINWLPVATMRRIVDEKGALIGFVQDMTGTFNFDYKESIDALKAHQLPEVHDTDNHKKVTFFRPWEVVHWRLRSKMMRAQYGYSVLDSSRWVWKRLILMEDTALVQKLTRSPGRYAFYVDTGDLPPKEAMALVKKVKRGYKKKKLVDPSTGQLDFRYNPLSPHEDFWVPTRGQKDSTRIEVVSGPDVQMMDDVEYFREKLRKASGVPDETEDASKPFSEGNARFARACMRVQREFMTGMRKVIKVHLAALNIDADSVKWHLKMTIPSPVFEMQQIEIMNARAALADSMTEWTTKTWILQHVFKFPEDDATAMSRDKTDEVDEVMKREAATQADIIRLYPQLQDMPVPEGSEPVKESIKSEIAGLKKIYEETSQSSSEVIKRFERLDSRLGRVEKTIKTSAISG